MLRLCYENKSRTGFDGMPTLGLALADEFQFQLRSFSNCEICTFERFEANAEPSKVGCAIAIAVCSRFTAG